MNRIIRDRLTAIAVSALFTAFLTTAVAFALHLVDRREAEREYQYLLPLAEKSFGAQAKHLVVLERSVRGLGPARRTFVYKNKGGKVLGAGISVRIDAAEGAIGLYAVTDEKGRVRATRPWPGLAGVRGQELEAFLKNRETGTSGGLAPSVDIPALEFSVSCAVDQAVRFLRVGEGGGE